jgi:TonB family protein
VGDWRGHWENSLGQRGDASWEVSSEYGGDVRGIWDSLLFQGRRTGNIVTFRVDGGLRSCNDYQVKVEISPQGNAANFTYQARNHCSGSKYSGTEELWLRTRSGSTSAPPAANNLPQSNAAQGVVQSAVLVRNTPPQYPPVAKAAGITGVVRLRVTIGPDGAVKDVSVISGNPLLAKAATDAVRHWQYRPTLVNGKPAQVETEAAINFTLGGR